MTDLHVRKARATGHLSLNRPEALNALTHPMCLEIDQALQEWAGDPDIKLVMIDAAGDKAFCAGGDIADLFQTGRDGDYGYGAKFWRDEYRLNARIGSYPKSYVAIMDGFVMGGGVGLSAHGSHRVVTERTMFALPECSIGLIPDVGATYLLGRMQGFCGEYAGLTGARLSGADCIYTGLADFFVPSDRLVDLKEALLAKSDVRVIEDFSKDPGVSLLEQNQIEIDQLFSGEDAAAILKALESSTSDFARTALKGFNRGAPLAVVNAVHAIRRGRQESSLGQALVNEYRFVTRSMEHGEFLEGIRAAIIDKDRSPKWNFPSIGSVPDEWANIIDMPVEAGDFTVA
jgi:enoyl-CoA hydratase